MNAERIFTMPDSDVNEWRQATLDNRDNIIELKTKFDLHIDRFERHLEHEEKHIGIATEHQQFEREQLQLIRDDINAYKNRLKGAMWFMFVTGTTLGFILRYFDEIKHFFRG